MNKDITLPDINLNNDFWILLYKNTKHKHPTADHELNKFIKFRYPKVILFLKSIYKRSYWYTSFLKYKTDTEYINQSSKYQEVWMKKDRLPIIKTLEQEGIIQIDHKYIASNSKAYRGSKSKGYRIHPKYYNERINDKKTYTITIKEKLYNKFKNPFDYYKKKKDTYCEIYDLVSKNITVNEEKAFDILKNLTEINENLKESEDYYQRIVKNQNKKVNFSYKSFKNNNTGQRIYYPLIFLPADMRESFEFGEKSQQVEISNAVPYLLSLDILTYMTQMKKNEVDLIIEIINKYLKSRFNNNQLIKPSFKELTEIINDICSELGIPDGWNQFKLSKRKSYFVKKNKYSCSEELYAHLDVIVFTIASSFGMIYYLINHFSGDHKSYKENKVDFNKYLNGNFYHRNSEDFKSISNIINKYFPKLNELLEYYARKKTRKLYLVVQNHEAKLMLENVMVQFSESNESPILPIHDGIICGESSSLEIAELIYQNSVNLFKIPAPVKIDNIIDDEGISRDKIFSIDGDLVNGVDECNLELL